MKIHFMTGNQTACGITDFRRRLLCCVDQLALMDRVTCMDCIRALGIQKPDPPETEETLP